jgi:hypothetical protein
MAVNHRRDAWLFAGLLGLYLILAAVLPAADDEVYYWAWARPLQFSYYDHPPLTAWMIRISTDLFGDSIFGFRVPACLAMVFVAAVIAHLSRPRSLLPGILLTPLFTIGAVLITPDTPLLCFWAAYVWWLVEVHRRLTPVADEGLAGTGEASVPWWMWLVGGVLLGCGVLGKYTMALAVPSGFVSFCLIGRQWKKWLPGYVAHGVVSFVVASPILIYNIQHDFAPLLFQWRHSMGDSRPGLKPFGEFVGVQILLFGTLPFFLYPWVLWNFQKLCENPRLRVCACLYALPMTFFLYKATRAPLQGNWALVMFVAFWPLAATWYQSVSSSKFWRWSTASAFLIPAACVLFLTIHLVKPVPFVPAEGDRVTRQYALNDVTQQIARTIRERGEALPVFTPTYQITAWLRFQSLDGRQIDQISRPSHFTQHPEHLTDVKRAYVVADHVLPAEFSTGFGEPELVGHFPVKVRGEVVRDFKLLLYSKRTAIGQKRSGIAMVNHEEEAVSAAPALLPSAIHETAIAAGEDTASMTLRVQIFELTSAVVDELRLDDGNNGLTHRCSAETDAKLRDLRTSGKLKIQSDPAIALRPHKKTRYFSGGEFPVPVPSQGGDVAVEWREFGTAIEVLPTPMEDGRVKLQLLVTISEKDPANTIELNGVLIPGLHSTRLQTVVMTAPHEAGLIVIGMESANRKRLLLRYELDGTVDGIPAQSVLVEPVPAN